MNPDDLGPLGWPLAGLAWAAFALPYIARHLRARRARRRAWRAYIETGQSVARFYAAEGARVPLR